MNYVRKKSLCFLWIRHIGSSLIKMPSISNRQSVPTLNLNVFFPRSCLFIIGLNQRCCKQCPVIFWYRGNWAKLEVDNIICYYLLFVFIAAYLQSHSLFCVHISILTRFRNFEINSLFICFAHLPHGTHTIKKNNTSKMNMIWTTNDA